MPVDRQMETTDLERATGRSIPNPPEFAPLTARAAPSTFDIGTGPDEEPRGRGTFRLRMVLGLVAFVALVAFVTQDEPPHYRDDAFLAQVDRRYRKIQNDHAVALYDRAVEELDRLNVPFPVDSPEDDAIYILDDAIYDRFDEEVDTTFWSGEPVAPPAQRGWWR